MGEVPLGKSTCLSGDSERFLERERDRERREGMADRTGTLRNDNIINWRLTFVGRCFASPSSNKDQQHLLLFKPPL